ncbi:hypothetical protein D3C77_657180 [compost metagenome]
MKTGTWIDQCLGLATQGFDQHAGAMTEAVDCATLSEVEIGVAFTVPQPGALTAHEHLRRTLSGGHQAIAWQCFLSGCGNR